METEQINFEFVKVPKKLILNLEESYLKIKEFKPRNRSILVSMSQSMYIPNLPLDTSLKINSAALILQEFSGMPV